MRQRKSQPKRPAADLAKRDALGRVFGVRRETWALQDDPRTTKPVVEVMATRRTASEAADLAREAAAAFDQRGFHKPSGSWWGADETAFHRFRVTRAARAPGLMFALASAAAGVAVVGLLRHRSGKRKQET